MRILNLVGDIRLKHKSDNIWYECELLIGSSTFYGSQPSYGYRASNVPYPMGYVDKPRLDDGSLIKIINWHLYGRSGGIVLEGNHVNTSFDKIIIDGIEIPVGTVQYSATYNETTVWFNWSGLTLPTAAHVGKTITVSVLVH